MGVNKLKRWALVDRETKIVHNVVIWDGVSDWYPNIPNVDLIECTDLPAEPGGKYENGIFLDRVEVSYLYPPEPPVEIVIAPIDNEVTTEPKVI